MRGKLPKILSLEEHAELGLDAAWWTFLPNSAIYAFTRRFLDDFSKRDLQAWLDVEASG